VGNENIDQSIERRVFLGRMHLLVRRRRTNDEQCERREQFERFDQFERFKQLQWIRGGR